MLVSLDELLVAYIINEIDNVNTQNQEDHISKRETLPGRWWPVAFYGVNFVLWLITALAVGAWDLLWLAILPLPALGLYLYRTNRSVE